MTSWEYATLDYHTGTGTIGPLAYGPRLRLSGWVAIPDAALTKASNTSLLAVLDLMGLYGWEMVGNAFDPTGRGRFIFKRPLTGSAKAAAAKWLAAGRSAKKKS